MVLSSFCDVVTVPVFVSRPSIFPLPQLTPHLKLILDHLSVLDCLPLTPTLPFLDLYVPVITQFPI